MKTIKLLAAAAVCVAAAVLCTVIPVKAIAFLAAAAFCVAAAVSCSAGNKKKEDMPEDKKNVEAQ
jgi:hypothetical protein